MESCLPRLLSRSRPFPTQPMSPLPHRRSRPGHRYAHLAALLLAALLIPAAAAAQGSGLAPAPSDVSVPVDTTGLARGPFSTMAMRYERTIFNVDILQLEVGFDSGTAETFSSLIEGQSYDDAVAQQVVDAALVAPDVMVRTQFLRDVSLDQFLGGMRDNLRNARENGYLTEAEETLITRETTAGYAALEDRGIRKDEVMWYRIRGDTLHVAFVALDGEVLVEDRPVGPERRMAVLGGYLGEGSDFREKLIRSLFQPE